MSIRFKETVATANFNASYGFTDFTTHSETTHFEITADAQNVAMIECKMLVLALVSLRTLSCEVDIADIEVLLWDYLIWASTMPLARSMT